MAAARDAAPSGLQSYVVTSVLGEGSFGMVWCVKDAAGKEHALKVARKKDIVEQNMVRFQISVLPWWRCIAKAAEQVAHIDLECEILRTMTEIGSPYIVRLHEAFQTSSRLFLVMEVRM